MEESTKNQCGAVEVRKRTIGAFITGNSEFETYHSILKQLKQRGILGIRIFAYRHFFRHQPYCKEYFQKAGLQINIWPKRIYKLLPKPWFNNLDALLVITDPIRDTLKNPRRSRYLHAINFPTIYLQHGVIQRGVNNRDNPLDPPFEFNSKLIFFFEELTENRSYFSDETLTSIHRSGFIKKPHVTPEASKYADILAKFQKKILFAHQFRTKGLNSSVEISNYFRMLKAFAKEHSETAIIIRPHRGRPKKWHAEFDTQLKQECPNVFFANQRSGLLKGAMMDDLLAVTDVLVSTPSTAILDALYMDIPVAVTINDSEIFKSLPQVNDYSSLHQFFSNTNAHQDSYDEFRKRFGNLDDNIEKTCEKIESYVLSLPNRNQHKNK